MEVMNFLRLAAPQKSKKRLMTLTIVLHLHMGLPHLFIQAVMGEQLLMRAAVLDIAVVHDIDPVRVSDGESRWAMTISVLPAVSFDTERWITASFSGSV